MKTLIDVLTALGNFVKIASEWAESASKAEVDVYTDLSAKRRSGQKSRGKGGHTGRSPQCSGKSVPQRTKGNGAEIAAKAWRQSIV